jgi:hypothetical protein
MSGQNESQEDRAPENLLHLISENSSSSNVVRTNLIPFFKPMKCQEISDAIRGMPQYSPLSKLNVAFPCIVQSVMVLNQNELQVNNVIVILAGTDWSNAVPLEFHLVQDIRPNLITTRAIVFSNSNTRLTYFCSFNCPNTAIPVLSFCGLIQLEFTDRDFSVVRDIVIASVKRHIDQHDEHKPSFDLKKLKIDLCVRATRVLCQQIHSSRSSLMLKYHWCWDNTLIELFINFLYSSQDSSNYSYSIIKRIHPKIQANYHRFILLNL